MQLQQIPHKVSICMHAAAFQSPAQRPTGSSRRSSLPSSSKTRQIQNRALRRTIATALAHRCVWHEHRTTPSGRLSLWYKFGITLCHVLLLKHFSVLCLRRFPHLSSFSAAYNPWLHFGRKRKTDRYRTL